MSNFIKNGFVFLLFVVLGSVNAHTQTTQKFEIGQSSFLLNGQPYVIRCGEMHFARVPKAEWRNRLKMAKAMGLNAVCAYLFWNIIEKQPDVFTWDGQSDAATFCKIAQEEGLYVILRPGPYSCAEWEFGGLPWWLLKDKTLKVRTQHPYYLSRCEKYMKEVGKQLAPLQINKGGNIIMVQVENEYGSYGSDTTYMNIMKKNVEDAGFTVPLFHCDGPSQLFNDHPKNLFAVVNFGSNPKDNVENYLRKLQPTGPLMCGEYYPGWFDSWGRTHHLGNTPRVINELKWMLDNKVSFSIYMVHGGTSFGLTSGSNAPPFSPQTTSYDYDAPINEAGNTTPKYFAMRELFSKYLQAGEILPNVPENKTAQALHNFTLNSTAALLSNLPKPVSSENPILFEDMNQGYGCMVYSTTLPKTDKAILQFKSVNDYALVYINNKFIGTIDRSRNKSAIAIPAQQQAATLTIVVEAMGRINYGGLIHDRKGIHGPVQLISETAKTIDIKNWKNYSVPLGEKNMPVNYTANKQHTSNTPVFYKYNFTADSTTDTYLDVRNWNKGIVWINGICLGRYWNIGPTQTMYLPGCWLKKGNNELVVYDLHGNTNPTIKTISTPILNELTQSKSQSHKKAGESWLLNASQAAVSGSFSEGQEWKIVNFNAPTPAQYFCLEALNGFDNQPYASCAEIIAIDNKGKEIPRSKWKVAYCSSEETGGEDGSSENLFDLQFTSIWHTQWQGGMPKHPHQVVIDMGGVYNIKALKILPRQEQKNGRIKDYNIYLSQKPFKLK